MTLAAVPEYDSARVDQTGGRAVVVGGSMAGLLAGRVLADAYETVVVLDRDPLPDERVARRGVPQSTHAHAMLEAGRHTLESLFPGYSESVLETGGVVVDMGSEFTQYDHGGLIADTPAELPMYCASRPLFEQLVRQRVRSHEGIELRGDCHVTGYLTDDAENVDGVSFTTDGDDHELAADLVVDATGRTSRTPEWLDAHGYESPPVEEVSVDLAYTTAVIERPPEDNRVITVSPSAPDPRGGTAVPAEDGRWIVTLFGLHGDHAPTDIEGFEAYADSLAGPEIRQLLANHEYVDDEIQKFPFPASRRRRYEQLDEFPDGLVVTGDAIASFNPIYGQGMSVAALDAMQLHETLATGERRALGTKFFEGAATGIDTAWQMATGADFEFPETEGPKPTGTDLFNRYTGAVMQTTHSDPVVAEQFYHVMRMEEPPTTLLRPQVAARVAANTLSGRLSDVSLPLPSNS
jgi:2-polyprenyl-6-methoxyphenol hydroxylase-like FAD-dependent oxidoreductase